MKEKVEIIIGNSKSRVIGSRKVNMMLREALKIRAKGYFFSSAYRSGDWDGYIRYVSESTGVFDTGILYQVVEYLKKKKIKYTLRDNQQSIGEFKLPKKIGEFTLRKDQREAVRSLVDNKFEDIPFQRGIMAQATNTGKSLVAVGIFAYFKKACGIFLVNSTDLFNQAYDDFSKLFPGEVGAINSKKTEWKRINVCMVQTIESRLRSEKGKYKGYLAKVQVFILDEADEVINRKGTKEIMGICHNAPVRVALTGSALLNVGRIKKDKEFSHRGSTKNQDQLRFFGPILYQRTNAENVKEGISAKPTIVMYKGNTHVEISGDFAAEKQLGIIENKRRNNTIKNRVKINLKKKRFPIVVLFEKHQHGDILYKQISKAIGENIRIEKIHGKTDRGYRKQILSEFNKKQIPVLLASMIIKRGLNLPWMKTLINAAGGDSHARTLQILGRSLRKDKKGKKKKVRLEDFWDIGKYLIRHSKHRKIYYRNEGFKVKEKYLD